MTEGSPRKLELRLIGEFGQTLGAAELPVGDAFVERWVHTSPPAPFIDTFETAVDLMKRREFRKDVFEKVCCQLGRQLGEHMEDAEGWHGADREESMKRHLEKDYWL